MRRTNSDAAEGSRKKLKVDPNSEKDLGKIESISLKNFMCHDNFEFKFGSRMNFIIGQNGSGKSAILTALMLALGGKSKTTGRFSNVRGFIKTGKQKAKIEVVLHNTGDYAYKPDLYGNKICVSREFTCDGSGSYKLKSESGKVVSSLKEELNNILNAMDIQVNNPIQLLTQEKSRNFLVSKDATEGKLYELFIKGTGLKKLEESYQDVEMEEMEAERQLERKKQALPAMKEDLKRWKKFLDSSQKVTDYKKELLWATVIEMEKRLEKKQHEYAKVENSIKITKQELEKCKNKFDVKNKEVDEYTKSRSDCSATLAEYRNKLSKLNADRENCSLALHRCKGSLDLHKREQQKISNEMKHLENRINENIQKNQLDVREEENKRQQEIGQLQESNKKINFELENVSKERRHKMEEQEQTRQRIDNLVAEMNELDFRQKRIEDDVNRQKMALKNKLNVYGDFTQNVQSEISRRAREFKAPPKGPIGMYLEVKDPRWSPAIEKCISRAVLCSYCVDNHQDDRLLKEILRKHCGNRKLPSTIVCQYSRAVYDVSQHKAQTNIPTVLDMMKIKDIQVANALIDQVKIENKILIEDSGTGQDLMMSNPPRNCFAAYTMSCDQICLQPYRYYSAEQNSNNSSILRSAQQDRINELAAEFNVLTTQKRAKQEEMIRLQNYANAIPSEVKLFSNQIVRLTTMMKENLGKLKDLDSIKETEDVNCLEEDLQAFKQDYNRKEAEIDECEQEVAKRSEEMQVVVEAVQGMKKQLCDEKANYDELGEKLNNCSQQKEFMSIGKSKFEKEANEYERKLHAVQAELDGLRKQTEDLTQKAESLCPRIDTERSIQEIKMQLDETSKVVAEQSHCDRKELQKKYNEKLNLVRESENDLKNIDSYIKRLKAMLQIRCSKLKDIASNTRRIINLTFISILNGNGYTGHCQFDVKNGTLKLEVAPKVGQKSRHNHNTLSGGERSYVTIAFLLALWERTSMPFRVLDEYDVFMDSNNRQLSVELLIGKAKEMESSQFIFLSPLDLPAVTFPKGCVNIHKMAAPKRLASSRQDQAGPSSD